jgi:hypothetical protein
MELLHCKYRTKKNKFNRKNYRWFFLCTLFHDDSSSGAGSRIAILRTIFPLGMQIHTLDHDRSIYSIHSAPYFLGLEGIFESLPSANPELA